MNVFLAASVSADAVSIALSFFAISYIFNIAYRKEILFRWRHVLFLSILTIAVGLSKNIYVIILITVLLIPVRKAGDIRKYMYRVGLVFFVALIVFILNSLVVNSILQLIESDRKYLWRTW